MKFLRALAAVGGLVFTAASPPRETGLDIPSAQSIPVLVKCIEQKLGSLYKEKPLENGGISIEWGEQTVMFIHYQAGLILDITDGGDVRHIVVSYRHPMSKGAAAKSLRVLGRKCFPYELEAAGGGKLP